MIYRKGSVEFGQCLQCGYIIPAGSDLGNFPKITASKSSNDLCILIFSLYENLRFSPSKILLIFFMIVFTIHKISYYKVRASMGSVETRWLGGSFLMVYRNNAGRLGSGFISVCLETCWPGHLGGFYVPERPCMRSLIIIVGGRGWGGFGYFMEGICWWRWALLFIHERKNTGFVCILSIFWRGGSVYGCMYEYSRTHTHTVRGLLGREPRGRDEKLGGPEESRWIESRSSVSVHVYKVHMWIYMLGRRDETLS